MLKAAVSLLCHGGSRAGSHSNDYVLVATRTFLLASSKNPGCCCRKVFGHCVDRLENSVHGKSIFSCLLRLASERLTRPAPLTSAHKENMKIVRPDVGLGARRESQREGYSSNTIHIPRITGSSPCGLLFS